MAEDETPGALFKAGRLTDAIDAAGKAVKAAPTHLPARVLLAEFLLIAGNYERADVILDAASQIDPSAAVVVAEFRQLLRAEMARRQLFREGRVPEFLGEPTEAQRLQLAALVALRAGDLAGAGREAQAAETARPRIAGRAADQDFDDFRDGDDLVAGSLEVLTTTGKYYWIPIERIESIAFHAPQRPRDLFWRRATLSVNDGPDGEVYIPAIYQGQGDSPTDTFRLGRATDWSEGDGPVRGIGQRTFLIGDDAIPIMDLTEVEFRA